jgi:hypothetical protein
MDFISYTKGMVSIYALKIALKNVYLYVYFL